MAIKWLPPQIAVLKKFGTCGMMYIETRRQFGKTTLFSGVALKQMMKHKGRLVTFASASLNVGKELIYKQDSVISGGLHDMRVEQDRRGRIKADATAIFNAMADFKREAKAANTSFNLADGVANRDYKDIDLDGIADLFERSRLEMRLHHSSSVVSRTQIIAPNPATARGFSGDVLIDEIGFIADFAALWEAMEPIASRDPSFRLLMASTPPEDEGHLCYKIGAPPEGTTFEPDGNGHWYRSEAGILTLRVDVWDAEQCGVRLYDLETKQPITPEQHRETSLDKDGWDRNYALKRIPGGLVAMSGVAIDAAQDKGKEECIALDLGTIEPHNEERTLQRILSQVQNVATGRLWGLGYDIATTTNKKSNPSSMTLCEARGAERWARLIVRWKSANPDFSTAVITRSISTLKQAGGRIENAKFDASNERYYATALKSKVESVSVDLVVSGEVVETGDPSQPTIRQKERLGNQLVNTANDRLLALPPNGWLKTDFLLQKKEKGQFACDLDPAGNHGDTFDSTKLAVDALNAGGPVEAFFPDRGDLSGPARSPHPSWLQPLKDLYDAVRFA
jgi:hypothetical protein